MNVAAAGIGMISSLTATGGAALVVTYLVKRGTLIHEAIGTAAAIGWPLAVAGTAGYVLTGIGEAGSAGLQPGLCLSAGARRHRRRQHAAGTGRCPARPPHTGRNTEKNLCGGTVCAGDEDADQLFLETGEGDGNWVMATPYAAYP